jgi:transcriptional regulator with XRE-family HTH domain
MEGVEERLEQARERAQKEREQLLKDVKREAKAQLFEAGIRLELAERGALYPQDLPYTELVGVLVKLVRQFKGFSESELARRSGVTLETISRLEHGKHKPQRRTVMKLADALEVQPKQVDPDQVFWGWPGYAEVSTREAEKEREQARIDREKVK